jgi:hypothetical protein
MDDQVLGSNLANHYCVSGNSRELIGLESNSQWGFIWPETTVVPTVGLFVHQLCRFIVNGISPIFYQYRWLTNKTGQNHACGFLEVRFRNAIWAAQFVQCGSVWISACFYLIGSRNIKKRELVARFRVRRWRWGWDAMPSRGSKIHWRD